MTQNPTEVVTEFYRAVGSADGDAIGTLVDTSFADDASIEWPPSLPHGGLVSGARKLRAIFSAIGSPDSHTPGPADLKLIRAIVDEQVVVAWITFDWADPETGTRTPSSALELWRFADGKVSEIKAYYWDHAVLTPASGA